MENPTDKLKDEYSMKAVYEGHTADVRVVVKTDVPIGGFVTGSRDTLVKLWVRVNENEYKDEHIFMGASHYIASLCLLRPSEQYPNGLILAGSNDSYIYGFAIGSKNPVMKLHGHSGVVCSLSTAFDIFASGSWDKTARVWSGQQCTAVLVGHEQAVWATQVWPLNNLVLTGSADRTIRIWRQGVCENVLYGHEDCVRGLAVSPNNTNFISCSNDGTVRVWCIDGQCLHVYYCHDNYIYSVSLLNNASVDFVTCSEDQSVKIWKGGQCVQTIEIRSKTLWSVAALENDDIVVGSSDGSVYVFGKGEFTPVLSSSLKDDLVEKENLNGDAGSATKIYSPKKVDIDNFSVKEKDFELYFDIAGTVRKVAFNKNENPSDVAQKFVSENSLDISNIPELIQLIVQNSELKMPFEPNSYFPLESYFFYTNANVAGLKAKLLEFNLCVPESKHIPPSSLEKLVDVANFPDVVSESQMQSLDIAVSWDDQYLFPVLDLLRLAVRCTDVCRRICNISFMNHLLEILKSEKSVNRMLVVKILCNLFGVKEGEQLMMKYQEKISNAVKYALSISDDKIHKSCMSLFLNYAVASQKGLAIDIDLYCCNLVDMLKVVTDADCLYKGFLSMGTICIANHSAILKFHSLDVIDVLLGTEKYLGAPNASNALEVLSLVIQNFQS